MQKTIIETRFPFGQVVVTPGAIEQAGDSMERSFLSMLSRHGAGDWGDLEQEDKDSNDSALTNSDARLFSAYEMPEGKYWVITEWDRSVTTILLPEEY
jgi:hypothetical protein